MPEREPKEQSYEYHNRRCPKCDQEVLDSLALYCLNCGELVGLRKDFEDFNEITEYLSLLDDCITSSVTGCSSDSHNRRKKLNYKHCLFCGIKL